MSMTEKMHVTAMGDLCPASIGGDVCEGCWNNKGNGAAVLISGVTKQAAQMLFEDCEIVPVGTLARIAELEKQLDARGGVIRILESDLKKSEKRVKALEAENKKLRESKDRCGICGKGINVDKAVYDEECGYCCSAHYAEKGGER